MKLSIIVPVYNMAGDGKLQFCLESLLNQTINDYEIIAVDDASADNSAEILRDYEKRYPERMRVICLPENHRQGGAKNAGLDVAQGEYIGFTDSDDFVAPDMFDKMLKRAEETGADIVGCDYYITHEQSFAPGEICYNNKSEQSGVLDDEKYKSLILDTGSLVVKIYKRSLFEEPKLRFPEHMFYEDNAIATRLFMKAKHFEYIQEPLYYYYQHSASTVHTITEERCRYRMDAMKLMLEAAK
uniref:glycosyltransferase family 2 protein n=1 Tax=Acetatifactor sp. TaxID=1872090 RepID=UPI0040564274